MTTTTTTTSTKAMAIAPVPPRGGPANSLVLPSSPSANGHATPSVLGPPTHHMPASRHNHNAAPNINGSSHRQASPPGIPAMIAPSGNNGSTANNNKLAMSRALGAAFLSHQVEQLEKSVSHHGYLATGSRRDLHRDKDRDRDEKEKRQEFRELGLGPGAGAHRRGPGNHGAKQRPPSGAKPASRKDHGERPGHSTKDADLVVVDASVLVHGLHQVKKWCKEGREEIVIVPLEALNTLDLLKKGTSALAQRARSASRILEAQVGTNPRIRVQRDDAFIPWDRIEFKDTYADEDGDKPIAQPLHLSGSPEWVRRMICCARWEVDHASTTLEKSNTAKPKVVLAVLSQPSALAQVGKMTDYTEEITSPVPLPAPGPHSHKYEPRSAGLLVAHWAAKAGIELLEVDPSTPGTSPPGQSRNMEDDDRGKRQSFRGRRNSHTTGGVPPTRGTGLVERPPAVMQMMEMVAQPSRVVRVLARGEKLEPDT
ncbi:hypothetical protein ID866_10020 [Astraeus odoratus]|nr:hypothetical protein ID866_10020 [Astraeus odoratus]